MKDFDRDFTQYLQIVNIRKISTVISRKSYDRKHTKDFDHNFTQNLRIVNLRKTLTVISRKTYES